MGATTTPPESHVLMATDFSDSAEAALGVAIEYARRMHARLHVLHVFSPGEIELTQLLADALARAEPEVPVSATGAGGEPAEEILRCASRLPADLIVVGTHGRTGVSRLLLGSVAERVVRGARCPVLVVPAPPPPAAVPAPVSTAAATETDGDEPVMQRRPCLVCATPTLDLICEPCRARIRGEALERKLGEERAGRS
jgi:nucleotide-binding universal stress UspA family protein